MNHKLLFIALMLVNQFIFSQVEFIKHQIAPQLVSVINLQSCDIDNDGDIDIVGQCNNEIVLYRNVDGNGTFDNFEVLISDFPYISTFVCEDVDLDGDIDIVSSSAEEPSSGFYEDFNIYWYKNNGGSFNNTSRYLITENISYVTQIKFEDINMDGRRDIIYFGQYSCGFYIIAWQGNVYGTFANQRIIYEGETKPMVIDIDDLNNDSNNDIVCGFRNGDVIWYDNTSVHDFPTNYYLHNGVDDILSIDISDINNDSKNDVIWYEQSTRQTICRYNIDEDTLFSNDSIIFSDPNLQYSFVYDIDMDNDNDIIVSIGDTVRWLENENNSFNQEQLLFEKSQISSGSYTINNINGDSLLDFVTSNRTDIGWYKHIDGNGLFSTRKFITFFTNEVSSYYLADLDNDGDIDIVNINSYYKYVTFFENNGNGEFENQVILFSANVPGYYDHYEDFKNLLIVKDFDNDGFKDIVLSYDNKIAMYKNTGTNMVFEQEQIIYEYPSNKFSTIYSDDINNDGLSDIVARYDNGYHLIVLNNLGNVNFEMTQDLHFTSAYPAEGGYGTPVTFKDIDNDSDRDIIAISNQGAFLFENIDGQGNYSSYSQISSSIAPLFVFSEDFDNNGYIDVLTANRYSNFLYLSKNNGVNFEMNDSIFSIHTDYSYGEISVSDFDNDSDIDLFITNPPSSLGEIFVKLLLNNGNGQFDSTYIICPTYPANMQIADMDNDGINDIVSFSGSNVYWLQTPKIVGINNLKSLNNNLNIYPNPTRGVLNIKSYNKESIKIYSIDGRLVKNYNNENEVIDVSNLEKGIYILRKGMASKQFIIN